MAATHVGQLSVCPVSGGSDCSSTAAPFANGLDQAPLRVQVYGDDNAVLPVSDPNYGRIYYRDDNGDLLTGLIPMDGTSYVRVSPYPGEYSNDGSAGIDRATQSHRAGRRPVRLPEHDSSTLRAGDHRVRRRVVGTQPADRDRRATVHANRAVRVTGCGRLPRHRLLGLSGHELLPRWPARAPTLTSDPDPNRPALFLTKDPDTGVPMMGLMFFTEAQTALTSLPLQQVAGQPEHNVAGDDVEREQRRGHDEHHVGFPAG